MTLNIITIVLDGMPWITRHWPEFEKLKLDWRWHVVEGVASNRNCTSWCAPMAPRLSVDGTTQYLDAVAGYDPRVILYRKELWNGKVAMMNEPLMQMHEGCLLMEVDSDELWKAEQIEILHAMFVQAPKKNCAYFRCDYRVGPKVRVTGVDTYGNNTSYEWHRAWRFNPGMMFSSHEPPVMDKLVPNAFEHAQSEAAGLVFRHEAYSTEAQVRFKERYYGTENNPNGKLYSGAVEKWRALQRNSKWPVKLNTFLPWVGAKTVADKA